MHPSKQRADGDRKWQRSSTSQTPPPEPSPSIASIIARMASSVTTLPASLGSRSAVRSNTSPSPPSMSATRAATMKMRPLTAPFISMPDGTLVYRTELIAAYERISELKGRACGNGRRLLGSGRQHRSAAGLHSARDGCAVGRGEVMTPQQLADVLLAQWQLLWPLPAAERIKRIDEIRSDYEYEDQLRLVAEQMELA
jgi:hypothetical protein